MFLRETHEGTSLCECVECSVSDLFGDQRVGETTEGVEVTYVGFVFPKYFKRGLVV